MIGTVWNSHFAASNALFGQFIQNYGQQSVALRGIMRNWDEARIDAFMRLDVNDVRDFYFADLANRANAWGKLFDNGAETIENALVTRYITETNRNAQVVGYVSGTALGRKTFKAINRLTLLAPPSTKPVVFVENMQDLLLSGKLSAEIDNGVVVIKARPDNGAWDEVARLSPDMSDATPVSNFQPADIRQTIYDPATGYSMALVCSGPRCSWVEGACFTAGTPVHTPAGLVPIEKISIGDTVLAYNESSKTPTLAPVTNVFHKTWRGLLRIIAGRDTLLATPNHPFYLPGSGRYMPADSLRRGMQLLALTGALLTVQSVAAVDTTVSVYNVEVAEHHNYYVGEEGVLVHNDCVFVKLGLRNLPQQTPAHPIFDVFTNVFGTTPQATLNRMQFLEDYGRLSGQARADFEAFFRADDLLGANPGITHEALLAARENRARAWGAIKEYPTIRTNVPLLEKVDDLIRSDGIFTTEEFSDILYYGTSGEAGDVLSFVNDISAFKKYNANPEGNSILRSLIVDTEVDLSRQIIEVVNKVDGYKGLAANQLLSYFENFKVHLGRHATLRGWLKTSPSLYDNWYFPHRDMFEITGLGEQTIYCRQNNLAANYSNLSNENIASIRYFSSTDGHEPLNTALGNNSLSPSLINYANRLEAGLNNCNKISDKLFRGLPFTVDANWVNSRYVVGSDVTEPTFMSCPMNIGTATEFANNLIYEINAIGNKGADIRSISLFPESEITFIRGTKFRVDEIKTPAENNGMWLIKMTEIP